MDLKQEILMDHYRNPRNEGHLEKPDFSSGEQNPSCGDHINIEGTINDGKLVEIAFSGKGCAVSLATASLLTEACKGKQIDYILSLDKDFIEKLIGVALGPTRLKCALLPLMALQKGLSAYKKEE